MRNKYSIGIRCTKGIKIYVTGAAFILIVLLLRYGNPQICRLIYIFQAYISPKYRGGIILPPSEYTGEWVGWYPNGRKMFKMQYKRGKLHGKTQFWYPTGIHQYTTYFSHGRKNGNDIRWYLNGVKWQEKVFADDIVIGNWRCYRENGNLSLSMWLCNGKIYGPKISIDMNNKITLTYYLNGKKVTRAQYMAAYIRDPTLPKPLYDNVKKSEAPKMTSKQSTREDNLDLDSGNVDKIPME